MMRELDNFSHASLPSFFVVRECDRLTKRWANTGFPCIPSIEPRACRIAQRLIFVESAGVGADVSPFHVRNAPTKLPLAPSVNWDLSPSSTGRAGAPICAVDEPPDRSASRDFGTFSRARLAPELAQRVHLVAVDRVRLAPPDVLGAPVGPSEPRSRPLDASLNCVVVPATSRGQAHQGRRFVPRCLAQRAQHIPARHRNVPSASDFFRKVGNSRRYFGISSRDFGTLSTMGGG